MHKLTKSIHKEITSLAKKLPKRYQYIKEKKYRKAGDIREGKVYRIWFVEDTEEVKEQLFEVPDSHKEKFNLLRDDDLYPVINIGMSEVNHKNKMKKAFKESEKKGVIDYLAPFLTEKENEYLNKQL